jgi:quercetin dioxygenase-like cupin family protein
VAGYVELHCHSAYSFLDGASQPEELAARAAELGYEALALTDHDGVYGSLEFAHAAKFFGVRPITGAEVTLSGVGWTEPPKSEGAGFAGAGAGKRGVGLTELPRRRLDGAGQRAQVPASPAPERDKSVGAGSAGTEAGGVGSTEPPKSVGAGSAGTEAGKGESITDRPGRRATLLVDADEITVSEFLYGPGERGAKPHVHHHHADGFLVLDGEFTFTFRDGPLAIPAGTFLLVPPGVVHGFDNDSTASARCFNIHAPSFGFGDYLRGRNPDFDQHDPPPDGGADPASTLAIRLSEGG